MFFQIDNSELSSYADDNTPIASVKNHQKLMNSLQSTQIVCLNGTKKSTLKSMQINVAYLLGPYFNKEITIANYNKARSNSEEVLGVVIETEATFAKYIENLCGRQIKTPCIDESSQLHDLRKVPLGSENIFLFFFYSFLSNLIIVLL